MNYLPDIQLYSPLPFPELISQFWGLLQLVSCYRRSGTERIQPGPLNISVLGIHKFISSSWKTNPLCWHLLLFLPSHFRASIKDIGLLNWLSGKESACQWRRCKRGWFDPRVEKIPCRRKWQPTPLFLPGKSHGQRILAGYSPRGHKKSRTRLNNNCGPQVICLAPPNHVDVWQKPMQYCEAIIFQLKVNKFDYEKKNRGWDLDPKHQIILNFES